MWNKLTYRKKNLLLLMIVVVLGFLAYHKAIKGTLQVMEDCAQLAKQVEAANQSPERLFALEQELATINELIGTDAEAVNEAQGQLMDRVGTYCDQSAAVLKEFAAPHQYIANNYAIITSKVEVEGDYLTLLLLTDVLERDFNASSLTSVRFYTKKQMKTKKTKLYAVYYLQNIQKL